MIISESFTATSRNVQIQKKIIIFKLAQTYKNQIKIIIQIKYLNIKVAI